MEKLIITLAHTGNVPTKKINEYTPETPEEIVNDIATCQELGIAVAHVHVRDEEGKPTSRRDLFEEVLRLMDEKNLTVIRQLSTGARGGENTVDWRGQMLDLNIEMASLATGSSNFPNSVNANSPELIEALATKMYANGIKPEIEAFDLAMIENTEYFLKKGILKGPLHFNLVMNVPGSIKGTPKNLLHMIDVLPEGSTWSLTSVGKSQMVLAPMAIAMGGHVRTGLEDVVKLDDGSLASNEILVKRIVKIAEALGRELATPDEARAILGLK